MRLFLYTYMVSFIGDYDNKRMIAIGEADPGAVPGISTIFFMGMKQHRRALKGLCFVRNDSLVMASNLIAANDNVVAANDNHAPDAIANAA